MKYVTWLIVMLLLIPATIASAQHGLSATQQGVSVPEKLYSLDVQDAPIRKVLGDLLASYGYKYILNDYVTGFVTLKLKDVPFDTAIRAVMKAAYVPLTYTRESGVYVVFIPFNRYPRQQGEKGYMPEQDFDLQQAPLREVVEKLLTEAKIKFSISPEVKGKITLKLQKVTWPVALTEMLSSGEAEYAWCLDRNGTYYIYPKRGLKSAIHLKP